MAGSKRLIIGLGNPGEEYGTTRHNVGFTVIDLLSEKLKIKMKRKGEALVGWGSWQGRPLGLLKPLTFMNRSGLAVEKTARDKKLKPEDLFVITDDINLSVGKTRVRNGGGHGGHNGIEDIIDWLDDNSFPRLRIGIGSDFERGQQSSYVLSPFTVAEQPEIFKAVSKAADASLVFVADGIVEAMNRFN